MLVRSVLAKIKSGHSRVFDCFDISLSINRARVHSFACLIGGVFVLSLLASKEPEYAVFLSCLYSLTAALPCKVGRDEYDRTNIENGNTNLKKKNPAVEIFLSIRRT